MKFGHLSTKSPTGVSYKRLPVLETENGLIYLVGDTATSKDGWAPVPKNVQDKIEWDTRPITIVLYLHQQKIEETIFERTQEGVKDARELLNRKTVNGYNYRVEVPCGEYGRDYDLWSEDCNLVGVSIPAF